MHTTMTDLQTFANVLERADITSRTDDGAFLTVTGRHPILGCVAMVQGFTNASIVSETPLDVLELEQIFIDLDGA